MSSTGTRWSQREADMNIAKLAFDFDDRFKDVFTNNVKTVNSISVERDVVYDDALPDVCTLDIYCPPLKGREKYPVLVDVHGGGWITGDKHWRRGLNRAFADMGLCVISPNYGLSPRFKYPECVKHLFACFKWICDHAEERRLDLDNVLITGDSAGGQLACLVLAIQNNAEVKARIGAVDSPLRFKGGMLVCGAYDPDSMAKNILSNKLFLEMTGYGRKHLREFKDYDLMNPVNFVDKDFPADVMVAYGRFDAFVGGNEKILFKRLNELGIPYREYRAKGAGEHCFHLWHYRRPISRKFFELARDYVADKVGYRYR